MSGKQPRPEPGNGQAPDRDVDLTAFALEQLTADEYKAIEARLQGDPEAARAVEDIRSLAHLLKESTPSGDVPPSAALRASVSSRLEELERERRSVTLCEKSTTRWSSRRWLLAASTVCAIVMLGVFYHQAQRFRSISDTDEQSQRVVTALDAQAKNAQLDRAMKQQVKTQEEALRHGLEPRQDLKLQQEAKLAGLVDQFNKRLDEQRYAEAEKIAQQAQQLDPNSEVVQNIQWQSRFVRRVQEQQQGLNNWGAYDPMSSVATPPPTDTTSLSVLENAPATPYAPMDSKDAVSGFQLRRDTLTHERLKFQADSARVEHDVNQASSDGRTLSASYGSVATSANPSVPLGWRKVQLSWDDGWWELDFTRKYAHPTLPTNEQYDAIHENQFVVVGPETALSTFSIDVDTASYANVRRFLEHNTLPPPDAVRIEELVNYFRYDYPEPRDRHPFSVNMEVAGCPWKTDHLLLRIGLKGQEVDAGERPPSNLVFLLDVSGSMKDTSKLPLLKRAMKRLVQQLSENDQVTIVTYAGEAGLRLDTTTGDQRAELDAAIDSLTAGGSTNGSAGIELAYQKAVANFIEEGTNRVILATDGDLNVGISDDEQLVQLIKDKAQSGVFLTVLGFGTGNLKDAKLEKLADHGNGMYGYVDKLREAHKVLVEQMAGTLVTIAKDVKIQVEFNPAEVRSYRLIGYENRVMAAQDFHDDAKDAGEIGAGHTVTALYEIVPTERHLTGGTPATPAPKSRLKYQHAAEQPEVAPSELTDAAKTGELLTLSLRYKPPEGNESSMFELPLAAKAPSFEAASTDFRFASMVAAFGMLLRGSQHCGDISLGAVEEWASTALGEDPHGYRTELVDLVRRARQLRGQ